MDNKISLKELAKIIKLCKDNGVSNLEFENLKLRMTDASPQVMTPAPQARGSAKKAKAITEKADLQSQYDVAQVVAETLHVEDPVAYEAMLMRGELGEEKNH